MAAASHATARCAASSPTAQLGDAPPTNADPPSPDVPLEKGRQVLVRLKAGGDVSGELVREDDEVLVLRIAGVETRIPRSDIVSVTPLRSLQERYRSMRAIIDDNDVDRLLILIEWLVRSGLLDEARSELDHVQRVDPDNPDAARLRSMVDRLLELRRKSQERPRKSAPQRRSRAPRPLRPGPESFPLLSDQEINRIKVYEIDLDHPPRLVIPKETIEQLFARYGDSDLLPADDEGRKAFANKPPVEILRTMFQLRARDLYDQVQVLELPRSLQRFRRDVHNGWLLNACASTRCHGGLDAGDFLLYTRNRNSERTVVTNFLILDRFRTSQGQALINYDQPEASPLLQMALPARTARPAHPPVRGWRPIFRSPSDRRFRQTVAWIRSMHQPRSDYGVEYQLPTAAALRGALTGRPAATDRR